MEFNENSKQYRILLVLHVSTLVIACALIGILSTVIIAFGFGTVYLLWSSYDTLFNTVALTGLFAFFILGVAVHYMVLHAIHFTKTRFVTPFIIFHVFLISLNIIVVLIDVGEMVTEQRYQFDLSVSASQTVLVIVSAVVLVEVLMLVIVVKLRFYLRNKRRYIRHGLPPPIREVIRPSSTPVIHCYNVDLDRSQSAENGDSSQGFASDKKRMFNF